MVSKHKKREKRKGRKDGGGGSSRGKRIMERLTFLAAAKDPVPRARGRGRPRVAEAAARAPRLLVHLARHLVREVRRPLRQREEHAACDRVGFALVSLSGSGSRYGEYRRAGDLKYGSYGEVGWVGTFHVPCYVALRGRGRWIGPMG